MTWIKEFLLIVFLSGGIMARGQVVYPHEVKTISVRGVDTMFTMAYMDISPANGPAKNTILLLHGKNFNGYYWKDIIATLSNEGFRLIIPDQVGWGKSDKPVVAYSFHWLASNTAALLDSLAVKQIIIVGHSMGGMLASRFAMLYPERVSKLVLENPIGLEDYKRFVPMQSLQQVTDKERKATYDTYKKYQQSYYPVWKPAYEQYVQAQADVLSDPNFQQVAIANALTYQMIYEQPVLYEWDRIKSPTLLIIGQADRTVVGKDLLSEELKKKYGQYPLLGELTRMKIKNSKLVKLPGVGHIPHIQEPALFIKHLLDFIR